MKGSGVVLRRAGLLNKVPGVAEPSENNSPPGPGGVSNDETQMLHATLRRRDSVVIGRGTECDVLIKDPKASRKHCQLTRKEDGFLLEDLSSKNGTYVNGVRITEPVILKQNETFKIGETIFYLS
jgi:pSer/pThr/pTyr-binding forkhead associated (FHA) protein